MNSKRGFSSKAQEPLSYDEKIKRFLRTFTKFVSNVRMRDRIVKTMQYGCQMILGYYAIQLSESKFENVKFGLQTTRSFSSNARKAFWLFKSFAHIHTCISMFENGILQTEYFADKLDFLEQVFLVLYMAVENIIFFIRSKAITSITEENVDFACNLTWFGGDMCAVLASSIRLHHVNSQLQKMLANNKQYRIDYSGKLLTIPDNLPYNDSSLSLYQLLEQSQSSKLLTSSSSSLFNTATNIWNHFTYSLEQIVKSYADAFSHRKITGNLSILKRKFLDNFFKKHTKNTTNDKYIDLTDIQPAPNRSTTKSSSSSSIRNNSNVVLETHPLINVENMSIPVPVKLPSDSASSASVRSRGTGSGDTSEEDETATAIATNAGKNSPEYPKENIMDYTRSVRTISDLTLPLSLSHSPEPQPVQVADMEPIYPIHCIPELDDASGYHHNNISQKVNLDYYYDNDGYYTHDGIVHDHISTATEREYKLEKQKMNDYQTIEALLKKKKALELSVAINIFEVGVSAHYMGYYKMLLGKDINDGHVGLMGVASSVMILYEGFSAFLDQEE